MGRDHDGRQIRLPRKLTKELSADIVKDIKEGSHQKYAALSNGISEQTFYTWIQRGTKDIEEENDTLCAKFVIAIAKVKQEEIKKCRRAIWENEKGHKGAEWTLEHAYMRQYSTSSCIVELAKEIEELANMWKNLSKENV